MLFDMLRAHRGRLEPISQEKGLDFEKQLQLWPELFPAGPGWGWKRKISGFGGLPSHSGAQGCECMTAAPCYNHQVPLLLRASVSTSVRRVLSCPASKGMEALETDQKVLKVQY